MRCPFEYNCEVTQVTRRFCQRCRLKKCLRVGMKKESILSPQEKLMKKQKIEENRQKKQRMLNTTTTTKRKASPVMMDSSSPQTPQQHQQPGGVQDTMPNNLLNESSAATITPMPHSPGLDHPTHAGPEKKPRNYSPVSNSMASPESLMS